MEGGERAEGEREGGLDWTVTRGYPVPRQFRMGDSVDRYSMDLNLFAFSRSLLYTALLNPREHKLHF
jgi:hypothetical protein